MSLDPRRKDYMLIFVIIAVIILIGQIILFVYVSKIPMKLKQDINKIDDLIDDLNSKLNKLENIENNISEIKKDLDVLSNKYPPEQTVNINNMNQQELNNMINNAIELELENVQWKINFNFILNIIFGSLLSLGGIYFILNKK